jgi:hypothetical protein
MAKIKRIHIEIDVRLSICLPREVTSIQIFVVQHTKEGIRMQGQTFVLNPGEIADVEVHGFTAAGLDVGVVPAVLTGSDNHTLQVNDLGGGKGTVTAVGAGGASADVAADDGQGHTDTAHGSITPTPVIDHIEVQVIKRGAAGGVLQPTGINPATGQPWPQPAGINPATGQPLPQPAAINPATGQPWPQPAGINPATGQPWPQPTGINPATGLPWQ